MEENDTKEVVMVRCIKRDCIVAKTSGCKHYGWHEHEATCNLQCGLVSGGMCSSKKIMKIRIYHEPKPIISKVEGSRPKRKIDK